MKLIYRIWSRNKRPNQENAKKIPERDGTTDSVNSKTKYQEQRGEEEEARRRIVVGVQSRNKRNMRVYAVRYRPETFVRIYGQQ